VEIGLREIYDKVCATETGVHNLVMKFQDLRGDQIAQQTATEKLEDRIRTIEMRAVVTPAAMWTAIGTLTTIMGVLVAILTLVVK